MSKTILFSTFSFLLLLTSCNKEDDAIQTVEPDAELLKADAIATFSNDLDFATAVDRGDNNGVYKSGLGNETLTTWQCADVDFTTGPNNTYPKTLTIDFGNTGCTINGVTRKGVLTLTFSGLMTTTGTVLTIQRGTNYYVNNYKVEGTLTFTNTTTDTTKPSWTRTITNGKITTPTGLVFTHTGTRNVQIAEGFGTLTPDDDVYHISAGTHTTNRSNGSTLTATVLETLIKKRNCNYISQGKLTLLGTVLNGVVDYGNNTCDNQATYTHSNGVTYNITM